MFMLLVGIYLADMVGCGVGTVYYSFCETLGLPKPLCGMYRHGLRSFKDEM